MRMPVAVRYTLIQLPELALAAIVLYVVTTAGLIGSGTAVLCLGFWALKDVVLYPLYRHALRNDVPTGTSLMLGRRAVVTKPLTPLGQVFIDGERWQARAADGAVIGEGDAVRIIGADGLVLVVEAVDVSVDR